MKPVFYNPRFAIKYLHSKCGLAKKDDGARQRAFIIHTGLLETRIAHFRDLGTDGLLKVAESQEHTIAVMKAAGVEPAKYAEHLNQAPVYYVSAASQIYTKEGKYSKKIAGLLENANRILFNETVESEEHRAALATELAHMIRFCAERIRSGKQGENELIELGIAVRKIAETLAGRYGDLVGHALLVFAKGLVSGTSTDSEVWKAARDLTERGNGKKPALLVWVKEHLTITPIQLPNLHAKRMNNANGVLVGALDNT